MTSSRTFLPAAYSLDDDKVKALQDVFKLEGGEVYNEHYDVEKYVKRRGNHLANIYQQQGNALQFINTFRVAEGEARDVFYDNSPELSVQEIRRREVEKEVTPLLPLPTTANSGTIDDFGTYPPTEWQPPRHQWTRFYPRPYTFLPCTFRTRISEI
jgi:hypothetical protein